MFYFLARTVKRFSSQGVKAFGLYSWLPVYFWTADGFSGLWNPSFLAIWALLTKLAVHFKGQSINGLAVSHLHSAQSIVDVERKHKPPLSPPKGVSKIGEDYPRCALGKLAVCETFTERPRRGERKSPTCWLLYPKDLVFSVAWWFALSGC